MTDNTIPQNEILEELKKINLQLAKSNTSRIIYQNFLAGFFHSFGNFLGTIALFFAVIFIASQFNWTGALTKSFENFASQINWQKIIPQPTIKFDTKNLFSP
jgi:hypothetical protein